MDRHSHAMRPLWSPAVAIVVAVFALAAAVIVFDEGSYVATLRIERLVPPIDRAAHQVPFLGVDATYTVPAARIHATYVVAEGSLLHQRAHDGELRAVYRHASGEMTPGRACEIVLRDPQPELDGHGSATIGVLLALPLGSQLAAPESESISLHQCDAATASELRQIVAHVDAWLAGGAQGTFEERVGSRWRGFYAALLVLVAAVALLAAFFLFRVDVEADAGTVRVVRSFGPLRRVVAEILASEMKSVRVTARQLGPFTFHRPALSLANDRVVNVWPIGRPGIARAAAAREALVRLFAERPRGEGGVPFRSAS